MTAAESVHLELQERRACSVDVVTLQQGARPSGLPSGKSGVWASRPRVLVAEDDDDMRSLLSFMLRTDGCDVIECRDGIELRDHFDSFYSPDDGKTVEDAADFDLVISDIRMPGFTAFDVLEEIQKSPRLPAVILITAFGDGETHERAYHLGAKAVFDKPFEFRRLLLTVKKLLAEKLV